MASKKLDSSPQRYSLSAHRDSINALAASPVDPWLVFSASDDKTVRIWHLRTKLPTRLLQAGDHGPLSTVCLDPHDEATIFVSSGAKILIYNLGGSSEPIVRSPQSTLLYSADDVSAMGVIPSLRQLVCCDDEGSVLFIDTATKKLLRIVRRAHSSLATCLAIRPQLQERSRKKEDAPAIDLATGGFDNTILFFNSTVGRVVCSLDTRSITYAEQQSAGGKRSSARTAATAARLPKAAAARRASSQVAHTAPAASPAGGNGPEEGTSAAPEADNNQLLNPPFVHAMAWSSDGSLLAAALGNGSLLILHPDSRTVACEMKEAHPCAAVSVGWVRLQSGYFLYSAGNDGTLCLWDVSDVLVGRGGIAAPLAGAGGSSLSGAAAVVELPSRDSLSTSRQVWSTRHGSKGPNVVLPIDCTEGTDGPGESAMPGGTDRGGLLVGDVTRTVTLYAW